MIIVKKTISHQFNLICYVQQGTLYLLKLNGISLTLPDMPYLFNFNYHKNN